MTAPTWITLGLLEVIKWDGTFSALIRRKMQLPQQELEVLVIPQILFLNSIFILLRL